MYIYYNPNPDSLLVGDCVIRAIAKLMKSDWQTAYVGVCSQGYAMRDMPSSNSVWGAYLKEKGYRRHTLPDSCPDCYTVKDFCVDHKKGRFLLSTGSHVVTAIDGDYFDTWDSGDETPLYYYEKED